MITGLYLDPLQFRPFQQQRVELITCQTINPKPIPIATSNNKREMRKIEELFMQCF